MDPVVVGAVGAVGNAAAPRAGVVTSVGRRVFQGVVGVVGAPIALPQRQPTMDPKGTLWAADDLRASTSSTSPSGSTDRLGSRLRSPARRDSAHVVGGPRPCLQRCCLPLAVHIVSNIKGQRPSEPANLHTGLPLNPRANGREGDHFSRAEGDQFSIALKVQASFLSQTMCGGMRGNS